MEKGVADSSMLELSNSLVTQLLNDEKDTSKLSQKTRRVLRQVKADFHGGHRMEWNDVQVSLKGLARTSHVRVHDDISESFEKIVSQLEEHRRLGHGPWNDTLPVQTINIPQYVQFLLALSRPANQSTHSFARDFLARPSKGPESDLRLYREIMSVPFEGDHWGTGYDDYNIHGWTDSDDSESHSSNGPNEVVPSRGGTRPRLTAVISLNPDDRRPSKELSSKPSN